jgi:hypothetical protein
MKAASVQATVVFVRMIFEPFCIRADRRERDMRTGRCQPALSPVWH